MKDAFTHFATGIAAGQEHIVGLKSDGTVVASMIAEDDFVEINRGQIDVSDWKDIVVISAAAAHTVGLKSDGTVVSVGENDYYQTEVADWTDIVAISAGTSHTVGLKSDGTVVGVGGDPVYADDLQELSNWESIMSVAAGYNYNLGYSSKGSIVFSPMDSGSDIDENLIDFKDWEKYC